jgi:uncharacterized protein YycO
VLPGTIVLGKIPGFVGKLVWLAQLINGDVSQWTHVGIVTRHNNGIATIFEARPGGAGWAFVSNVRLEKQWKEVPVPLTEAQRDAIVDECFRRVGTGYNWDTYFYLAAYRLGLPFLTRLFESRVSRNEKMICSQIVDDIYRVCGVQLFNDGRLPHDVTPGDIAGLLED